MNYHTHFHIPFVEVHSKKLRAAVTTPPGRMRLIFLIEIQRNNKKNGQGAAKFACHTWALFNFIAAITVTFSDNVFSVIGYEIAHRIHTDRSVFFSNPVADIFYVLNYSDGSFGKLHKPI